MRSEKNFLLSVIIPCYNEGSTIEDVIEAVKKQPFFKQIIVVDDGSTDATPNILKNIKGDEKNEILILRHKENLGKGAAIKTGLKHVKGDIIIIQDADLEYDPSEYPKLLQPIIEDKADVVFGSRFLESRRTIYFTNYIANLTFSFLINFLYGTTLTDIATGYKVFRREVFEEIGELQANDFSFEIEFTSKVIQKGFRIYEVPIKYQGRTYEAGKKIGWKHGFEYLYWMFREYLKREKKTNFTFLLGNSVNIAKVFFNFGIKDFLGNKVLELNSGEGKISRFLLGREFLILSDPSEKNLRILKSKFYQTRRLIITKFDIIVDDSKILFDALKENTNSEYFSDSEYFLDTCIAVDTLPKVDDDKKALEKINKILPRGGRAILYIPQDKSLFGKLDLSLGYKRRYDDVEVEEKIKNVGFEIKNQICFGKPLKPLWRISNIYLKVGDRKNILPAFIPLIADFISILFPQNLFGGEGIGKVIWAEKVKDL